jgi:hypothetical protein
VLWGDEVRPCAQTCHLDRSAAGMENTPSVKATCRHGYPARRHEAERSEMSGDHPHHGLVISLLRSRQAGFTLAMRLSFFSRRQRLICFSRESASSTQSKDS